MFSNKQGKLKENIFIKGNGWKGSATLKNTKFLRKCTRKVECKIGWQTTGMQATLTGNHWSDSS